MILLSSLSQLSSIPFHFQPVFVEHLYSYSLSMTRLIAQSFPSSYNFRYLGIDGDYTYEQPNYHC